MKRNLDYEAGFIRAVADDLSPEEIALATAAAARRRKLLIAGGVLLVAAVVVAGVAQLRRDTPSKQVARAKLAAANGDHATAVIELKRSLQESPDQPEARFLLAGEYADLDDAKAAEIEYRKAIATGLPLQRAVVPLVAALLVQGKFPQVVAQVNDTSVQSPEVNAELQSMLGTAYIALGKTEAGLGAFRAARDLVPDFSGSLIAQARYMVTQGRFEAAEAMLASVPGDDRRQAELQTLKGDIANALKRPQDAFVAFQAAVKLDPRNAGARMQLAKIYIDLGQLDLAQNQIGIVAQANPRNGQAQYMSAMVAYLRHDLPAARDAIDRSLQLAPGDGRAHLLAGVVAMGQDELVAAEPHLRESIQLLPPALEARKALVNLHLQRLEPAAADEALQGALAAQPADPELSALAVKIALVRGDAVTASRLFEQSPARQTADAATSLVGASLLFTAGRPDAAIARLSAASKADPDNSEIDVALVMGLLQLRRTDAALAAWQSLERKKPDSARAWELHARIDSARGDDGAARKALERSATLDPRYFPTTAALVALDLRAGRPDQARDRLKRAIADDPRHIDALLLLVQVEEANGGTTDAVADLLATARTQDPKSTQAIADTIAFHRRHGDAAATLEAAEQGLLVAPNNQAWLSLVGDLSLRADRPDRAFAAFTKLTALNKENGDYATRLGLIQLSSGKSEAALASFRNAFKLAPQRTDLQGTIVDALLAAGKTDEATRALFEIAQRSPDSPLVGELDADIKLAAKQYPEALDAYRQAMAAAPSTRLVIKNYKALVLAKQRRQADAILADWRARHPADLPMWLFDAQVALDAKDYDSAANAYRKALDVQPNDPAILNNLAWTLDQRRDPNALGYAEKAYALAPGNADLSDTLGWILVNQGQTKRGVEAIARASALAPQNLDIRVRLAKAQIKDGSTDAARATLKSVIDKAPNSAEGSESRTLLSTL